MEFFTCDCKIEYNYAIAYKLWFVEQNITNFQKYKETVNTFYIISYIIRRSEIIHHCSTLV